MRSLLFQVAEGKQDGNREGNRQNGSFFHVQLSRPGSRDRIETAGAERVAAEKAFEAEQDA